MYSNISSVT